MKKTLPLSACQAIATLQAATSSFLSLMESAVITKTLVICLSYYGLVHK